MISCRLGRTLKPGKSFGMTIVAAPLSALENERGQLLSHVPYLDNSSYDKSLFTPVSHTHYYHELPDSRFFM